MAHFFQSNRKAKGKSLIIYDFILFSCSPVKLVGSTTNDFISHLPFKEHQNNAVWETNLFEKCNREESILLQTAVNDDNFQRVTEKEIQTSEVQPDVLRGKIVQDSLLSQQGSKTKQVSNINQILLYGNTFKIYIFLDCLSFGYALMFRN